MKLYILLAISLITLSGCSKDNETHNPVVNSYPMNVGSEWNYTRQIIIEKYASDTSNIIVDRDTIDMLLNVQIEKDTILNDTLHVKVFKTYDNYANSITYEYKSLDQEGLKYHGNQYISLNNNPKKISGYYIPSLKNNLSSSSAKDIFLEKQALLELKLPLFLNSTWVCRFPLTIYTPKITKTVIAAETINIAGHTMECFKIDWSYNNHPDYDGTKTTEWYSSNGLVKKQTAIDRIAFTNENGDIIYYGSFSETITLQSFTIK
jgi:hypothetical protein